MKNSPDWLKMKIFQSIFFERAHGRQHVPAFLLLLLLSAAPFSCAKVGDPLPPLPSDAVLVETLEIVISGDDLLLTFSPPPRELSEIEIYRLCEGEADDIRETPPVAVLPGEEIRPLSFMGRSYVAAPPESLPGECIFAVRTRGLGGKRSDFSNQVRWAPVQPPPLPLSVTAETFETSVQVQWEAPERRPEGQPEYLVNFRETVLDNTYMISEFSFGEPLSFEVRTMVRSKGTILLSEPLVLEGFVPEDVFPPDPPSGLVVVRLEDRVQLTWEENDEPDLAGYYVYRAGEGKSPEKISGLISFNRFVDENPPAGTGITYHVTAVDKWENESDPS